MESQTTFIRESREQPPEERLKRLRDMFQFLSTSLELEASPEGPIGDTPPGVLDLRSETLEAEWQQRRLAVELGNEIPEAVETTVEVPGEEQSSYGPVLDQEIVEPAVEQVPSEHGGSREFSEGENATYEDEVVWEPPPIAEDAEVERPLTLAELLRQAPKAMPKPAASAAPSITGGAFGKPFWRKGP